MLVYQQNPRIIDRMETNGDCYLFDPVTAAFRRLNRMGRDIWVLIESKSDVSSIVREISSAHQEVPESKIRTDVEAFLDKLVASNLVLKEQRDDERGS